MDIHKVLSLLPHRYPFLLVDRVVEFEPDKRLLAYKNVTYNEPFFTGHFPVRPVMPGVLIVERPWPKPPDSWPWNRVPIRSVPAPCTIS